MKGKSRDGLKPFLPTLLEGNSHIVWTWRIETVDNGLSWYGVSEYREVSNKEKRAARGTLLLFPSPKDIPRVCLSPRDLVPSPGKGLRKS